MKKHTPINLYKYEIVNSKNPTTTKEINNALKSMLTWITQEQQSFITKNYEQLVNDIANNNTPLKGSLNKISRDLKARPLNDYHYQAYNLAEMFGTNILTLASSQLQSKLLNKTIKEITNTKNIKTEEITPREITQHFKKNYPNLKTPSVYFINNVIRRIINGNDFTNVTPAKMLPFWATDTHYSKVTNNNRDLFFTLKLENIGLVTLKFKLPANDRFNVPAGAKVTRPTVSLDGRGRLRFGFTIQEGVIAPSGSNVRVGVDLGVVEPFVATIVDVGNGSYSPPIYPSGKINALSGKIDALFELCDVLFLKEQECRVNSRVVKADVLRVERERVRAKISRLKVERANAVAFRLVGVAELFGAMIVLEDLGWVPNSKWEQARVSRAIESGGFRRGVKVRKVSARDTSRRCSSCGGGVSASGRLVRCVDCRRGLDRDVNASRNVSVDKRVCFDRLSQFSVSTRLSSPVVPGDYPVNVLGLHVLQVRQH